MVSRSYENKLWRRGFHLVAGIDEAGRGPLAGPVVAAAVIFPSQVQIPGINDSKQLSPAKREVLFGHIKRQALALGWGIVNHRVIDQINILQASLLAMKLAVEKLALNPDYLLIDGRRMKVDLPLPQRSLIDGDARCFSIAAASIVAKVIRDRLMLRYHRQYPLYNFARHKGYGTVEHFKKLEQHGPCPIHRRSFCL